MDTEKYKQYQLLNKTMRQTYDAIGKIYCPILKKEIIFNAKGFHHLHYKPDGTARKTSEKIHKLTLLPLAVTVIKKASEIHEARDILIRESRKKGSKLIKAKQYALVTIAGKKKPVKVRVIILDKENSQNPIFWSIMKH